MLLPMYYSYLFNRHTAICSLYYAVLQLNFKLAVVLTHWLLLLAHAKVAVPI